jgi:hypothetical protein
MIQTPRIALDFEQKKCFMDDPVLGISSSTYNSVLCVMKKNGYERGCRFWRCPLPPHYNEVEGIQGACPQILLGGGLVPKIS